MICKTVNIPLARDRCGICYVASIQSLINIVESAVSIGFVCTKPFTEGNSSYHKPFYCGCGWLTFFVGALLDCSVKDFFICRSCDISADG